MFLDIHAHSGARDIFIYAPSCDNDQDVEKAKALPKILSEISPYFSLEGCKIGNEKYKKNCARLCVFRDFSLPCSYTIEASCWGYTDPASDYTYQFKELDFMKFGQHLAEGIAKQQGIKISPKENMERHEGLDILIDFGLYEDESETKQKIKQNKKTGKLLGGKLLKRMSMQP